MTWPDWPYSRVLTLTRNFYLSLPLFHSTFTFGRQEKTSIYMYIQGLYGVYTRTSSYIDWIRENINPKGLNAGQLHTTVSTTTVKATTAAPTTRPGEKKISEDCGGIFTPNPIFPTDSDLTPFNPYFTFKMRYYNFKLR